MAHLALSLLGPFRATLDDQPVVGLSSDRLRALVGYLAVDGGREYAREQVAALLWPERSDQEALRALRFALSRLHNALGDRQSPAPFILVTRTTVQFNQASDHWLDVTEFESLARARTVSSLQRAIGLYRGSFLEGLSAQDSPALEDWLLLRAEAYRRTMLSVLTNLTSLQTAQGDYGEAVRWARRQLEIEPYREQAHRQLMVALALDGDRAAALAAYETCRRLLWQELACEPEDETRALCTQIREGVLAPPRPPPAPVQAPSPVPVHGAPIGATPRDSRIVAREQELARLDTLLTQALTGRGGMVLVSGEPGSGKTALLDACAHRAARANQSLIALWGSCNAHEGAGDPYLPFREILETLAGDVEGKRAGGALSQEQVQRIWEALPVVGSALVTHGPDLLNSLVSGEGLLRRAEGFPLPGDGGRWKARLRDLVGQSDTRPDPGPARPLPVGTDPPDQRPDPQAHLFAQVTQVLHTVSQSYPLLLLIDDLQWADGGSTALLFHLGRRLRGSRILIACACRPEAFDTDEGRQDTARGVSTVLHELSREWGDVTIDLDRVDGRAFVEAYVDSEPNRLGESFRQALYDHTEGNPLFTVELLRCFERAGTLVRDGAGRWVEGGPLLWERWPPQVEAVIAQHMDALPREDRSLLRVASVQGETFVAEVAARVLGWSVEDVVRRLSGPLRTRHRLVEALSLDRLAGSGQRLSTYRFRHAMLQLSAYSSLDAIERAMLHEATARAIEAIYGAEEGSPRDLAPELAHHFERASMPLEAARYRLEAGWWAIRLVAYEEAIRHLERGIALLDGVAPTREKAQLELSLYLALRGPAFIKRGRQSPLHIGVVKRLSDLIQHPDLQDDPQRLTALTVVARSVNWSADPRRGKLLGEQMLALAQDLDAKSLMQAHVALGHSAWLRGELSAARDHLTQALAIHDQEADHRLNPVYGVDSGTLGRSLLGYVLWLLGYPDQGRTVLQEALVQAERLGQSSAVGFVRLIVGTVTAVLCRDKASAASHGAALREHSKVGPVYDAWSGLLASQAKDARPNPALSPAVETPAEAGSASHAIGSGVGHATRLLVQARMYAEAGEIERGLGTLERAQAWIDGTGVRLMEAEVWRMRGELVLANHGADLAGADGAEALACFQRALDVARAQGSRWFELRTAVNLARFWQARGRSDDARELLRGVYGWFVEGFDTVDLMEAKDLLDALG